MNPLLIENGSHLPPMGSAAATFFSVRSLRSLPLHCVMLCATAQTGWLASERVARADVIENHSQNICLRILEHLINNDKQY